MPDDYTQMWSDLGIDLDAHDGLLEVLPPLFSDVFLSQKDRPARMSYFDYVFSEVHGLRIRELVNHKKSGGIVVGTYCTYAPEEIIMAAGGISVGLCAGAEVAPEAAMEFLPGNLCPLIKSSLGFKLAKVCPYIESCDLLIGETTCDGKKKFYEILGEMQPVHVMELPQKKGAADDILWKSEIRALMARLQDVSGRKVTAEGLAESIKVVNEKRRALARLAELRKCDPPVISGRDSLLINQIAFNDDPRRFTVKLNELCDELDKRRDGGKCIGGAARPRVMISGCPMALPNWKLANVVETSGAAIVMEEMCTGVRNWRNLVDESASDLNGMLDAIAERYLKIDCAVFTPNQERIDNILSLVRDYDVDAVVYGALTACDPYTIEAYKVQKALDEAGVPMLYVETDYGDDSAQIATRVQALLEMVS
jgi:benzoyl-CoA reductase/2-hydroxyglutaryl-CoA dehydratase subunit BcrC/BadD/HgdB